jgi:hypothetical protein
MPDCCVAGYFLIATYLVSLLAGSACVAKTPRLFRNGALFLRAPKLAEIKLGVLNTGDQDFSLVHIENSYTVSAFPDF